jgi:hypothetical protein
MICEKCGKKIRDDEFASLNRRQISALLEKAVMDGKVKDTKLFQYEGMGTMDAATEEVLRTYFYGFEMKKAREEVEVRTSKRLLRVKKDEDKNSEE